jgi:hypothetical protein
MEENYKPHLSSSQWSFNGLSMGRNEKEKNKSRWCKKNALNENLSMVMYALVHKLLPKKSEKKTKSKRTLIMK